MNRLRKFLYLTALIFAVASVLPAQQDKEREKEKEKKTKVNGRPAKSTPAEKRAEPGRGYAPGEPARTNMPNYPGRGAAPGARPNFVNDRPEARPAAAAGFRRPDVVHGGMVRTPGGAVVYHAPGGARRFVVNRPGGGVIVTNARGHGYMERPIVLAGGTRIVQRTYFVGGVSYVRVYRPVVFGGIAFNIFTPMRFYTPGFYAWGYTPWIRPVVYAGGFGWVGPGFGFYAGYFAPYPYYAGPNYWLTDYLIAASLQQAYQERMDAAAAAAPPPYDPNGQVALSPQVKDLIAAEVQRDLAQERMQAQNPQAVPAGPPPVLDGQPHVFVVSTSLVANNGYGGCALTEGDVLQLNPAPSPDPNFANVRVLASKAQDCPANQIVPVQLTDLQDMQNNMRATIDQGLGEMQNRQGQGGLPPIDPSMRAQTPSPIAAQVPPPDPNVAAQLQQQAQEANREEQQALAAPNPEPVAGPGPGPAPAATGASIQMGQTTDQVIAIMGKPASVVPGNGTKVYVYQDLRVTFTNGVVTDIQ